MTIPILKLPSSGMAITFREATVEDCLAYCDVNDALDELTTTTYLNSIQVGELKDSALWTAEDRRTALWWIFVTTSKDTTIAYEYPCGHCGEAHTQLVDFVDLDDEALTLKGKPYIKDSVAFNGIAHDILLHPYNGLAMMSMEQAANELEELEAGSMEHKKAAARLKVLEVAHAFDFVYGDREEFEEELEVKLAAIHSMSRINEFDELVTAVIAAKEKLKHGLNSAFVDGRVSLISPPLSCETKTDDKGEALQSRLLIPFLGAVFIPTI
jgi:hypothetical protein